MSFNWTPSVTTALEQENALRSQELGLWDYAKLQAKNTFERSTTTGLLMEEQRIKMAEGTLFEGYVDPITASVMPDIVSKEPVKRNLISEEDFKARGYDMGGRIKWEPTTTVERAEIEKEILERRDYEKRILDNSDNGVIRSAVGFGAALIGSLPDPVNFIPVVGQAAKGATLGARVAKGAVEGFVGSAISTAIVSPVAADKGEDISFADIALDLTFGALIGAGVGTASGLFHNRRVKGMEGEKNSLRNALVDSGMDEASAISKADQAINVLADTSGRSELALNLRKNLSGLDRVNAGRLMDRAITAITKGEPVDIDTWAKELGSTQLINSASSITGKHLSTQASNPQRFLAQTQTPVQPAVPTSAPQPASPTVTVVAKNGKPTKPTDFLTFSKDKYNKNRSHNIEVDVKDGNGITRVRVEDSRMRNVDIAKVPAVMRDFEPVINSPDGKMWVVDAGKGQQLIVYDEVIDGTQVVTAQLNKEDPMPTSRALTATASEGVPPSAQPDMKVAKVDGQEISTDMQPQSFAVGKADETIDFMPPDQAEDDMVSVWEAALDAEYNELATRGGVSEEDMLELKSIDDEIVSVNNTANAALESLECIVGAVVQ